MLQRLQDAPDQVIGLSASGTVVARDIEDAICLSTGPGGATPAGLVVVVDRDFDGYFAEIGRALANAPRTHTSLVRLALVTDADRLGEARLSGFGDSPVRLFATAEQKAALEWAASER